MKLKKGDIVTIQISDSYIFTGELTATPYKKVLTLFSKHFGSLTWSKETDGGHIISVQRGNEYYPNPIVSL